MIQKISIFTTDPTILGTYGVDGDDATTETIFNLAESGDFKFFGFASNVVEES